MKRQILHWTSALLACVAMLATACEKSEDEKPVTPVFPEAQSISIPTGETRCEVSFTPNMDWTISIPTDPETAKWFWLLDGEIKVSSISGSASKDPVTITVATTDQVEFDATPSCEVSLTMDEQTKVIATVTRSTNARTLDIYQAEYDSYAEIFNYGTYLETPVAKNNEESPVEMLWSNNGLEYVFKITSNFGWSLNNPNAWLTKARETEIEGDKNSKELRFDVVFTEDILDGASGSVDFYDTTVGKDEDPGNNAHNRYYFKIPAVRNVIRHSVSSQDATYNFSAGGKYTGNTAGMEVEMENVTARVASAAGIKFYVLEQTASGYKPYAGENTDKSGWLTIVDTWDAKGEAFQMHQYSITASANTSEVAGESTEARTAQILALPKTLVDVVEAAASLEEGLLANNDLKEEYKPYVFATAQQAGSAGEGGEGDGFTITDESDPYYQSSYSFEDITNGDPYTDEDIANNWEVIDAGGKLYRLTYKTSDLIGIVNFLLNGEYSTFIVTPQDSWLGAEIWDGILYITMAAKQYSGGKGNITIYADQSKQTVLARIICIREF